MNDAVLAYRKFVIMVLALIVVSNAIYFVILRDDVKEIKGLVTTTTTVKR